MPSATIHWAGDLSRVDTHSSRFLPSNRTMASEGGAVLLVPGVTTGGTGSQTSVSWCFGVTACCAERDTATAIRVANAKNFGYRVCMILNEDTPNGPGP